MNDSYTPYTYIVSFHNFVRFPIKQRNTSIHHAPNKRKRKDEAPFRLCIYTLFHAHTCFSCGLSLSLMEVIMDISQLLIS